MAGRLPHRMHEQSLGGCIGASACLTRGSKGWGSSSRTGGAGTSSTPDANSVAAAEQVPYSRGPCRHSASHKLVNSQPGMTHGTRTLRRLSPTPA